MSKRVFLESPFLLCSLKVFRTFQVFLRANLKGAEKKRTLQKHPFGQPFLRTTPSPLLWRALSLGVVLRHLPAEIWKRLKGKNPEGKNFRKLLRRKQSSAKISKISRNTIKSSAKVRSEKSSEISSANIFSSAKFSEVFALCVFTLWIFPRNLQGHFWSMLVAFSLNFTES